MACFSVHNAVPVVVNQVPRIYCLVLRKLKKVEQPRSRFFNSQVILLPEDAYISILINDAKMTTRLGVCL